MHQRLKNLIISNFSLLIIVAGSLCNFMVTLFWKKHFESTFDDFTLLSTFISITISFGLLGLDQVFLRLSIQIEGKNYISKKLIRTICITGIIFPLVISVYFFTSYGLSYLLLILLALLLNITILAYNSLRLSHQFTASQIVNNGYKIIILIIVIYFFIQHDDLDFERFLFIFNVLLFIFCLVPFLNLIKSIRPYFEQDKGMNHLWLSFLLNLGVLTFIGYGDRLLIAELYGTQMMGKYFYYSTVFLFPFTLLQFYIGFKELIIFKKEVNRKMIHQKIVRISVIGLISIVLIFLTVFFINNKLITVDLKEDLWMIILLSILGISKLIYGLFSALIGAVGDSKELYRVSLYSLFLVLSSAIIIVFFPKLGIGFIIISLIIIYIIRCIYIYSKIVLKQS